MKRKVTTLTTIVTILFCLCAAASPEATSPPAAAPTAKQPTDLAPTTIVGLIVAIRNAKDVATAAKSYSEARVLDKDDTEVHEEYMKKMLTLGHPKIAAYPAMELKRLQAKNGTAWGVVGYNDAKRGKYLPAFMSTIQGMALLPDDPGIQNNAGILMAWYETRPGKPKLSVTLKALLEEHSQKWLGQAKYAEAHSKSTTEFAGREERMAKLKAEFVPAEEAAKAAARESSQATDRYRQYARTIAGLQDDLRALKHTYERASRSSKTDSKDEKKRRKRLMAEVKSKIKPYKKKIESLQKESRSVYKEAAAKAEILSKAKMALAKAQTALKAEESIKPSLAWLPPAVDGAITPEDPNPPKFAAPLEPTSKPSAGSAADAQLKMAKLLLQNNRTDKAGAILEFIIKKYPDSKAAKEAAELLKKPKADKRQDL